MPGACADRYLQKPLKIDREGVGGVAKPTTPGGVPADKTRRLYRRIRGIQYLHAYRIQCIFQMVTWVQGGGKRDMTDGSRSRRFPLGREKHSEVP